MRHHHFSTRVLCILLTLSTLLSYMGTATTVLAQGLSGEGVSTQTEAGTSGSQGSRRDPVDQTENTAALGLSLESLTYTAEGQEATLLKNGNTVDASTLPPESLATFKLTLAFTLKALGEEGIMRGDTFTVTLPQAETGDEENPTTPYFTMADAVDQPLYAGRGDAAVFMGTYTITNNTLTATFDGAAEGLAQDNRGGELTLSVNAQDIAMSDGAMTTVDFNLQGVMEDADTGITAADQVAATQHLILPQKTPAENTEDDPVPSVTTPEPTSEADDNGESIPAIVPETPGAAAGEEATPGPIRLLAQSLYSLFTGAAPVKGTLIKNGVAVNKTTTTGDVDAFSLGTLSFTAPADGYTVANALSTPNHQPIDFITELRLNDDYLTAIWDKAVAGHSDLEGLYEAAINAEAAAKPTAYQTLNDTLKAKGIKQITYAYNFGPDLKLPNSVMNENGKPKVYPLKATIDGIEQTIASYTYTYNDKGELVANLTFEPFVCCMESVKAQFKAELYLTDSLFTDSSKVDINWNGDKAIIEVVGRLDNKDKPTKDNAFEASKTAAYTEGDLYIDYTIAFSQKPGSTEILDNAVMVDALPSGLTVESVTLNTNNGGDVPLTMDTTVTPNTYQLTTDANGINTLKYTFPDSASITSGEFKVRAMLTPAAYQAYMDKGSQGIATTFANTAYLKNATETEVFKKTDETTTEMKAQFFTKDGHQNQFNGNIFDWAIKVNTYFSTGVQTYIVDEIDASQHTLMENTLKISTDGGAETTIPLVTTANTDITGKDYTAWINAALTDGKVTDALKLESGDGAKAITYTVGTGENARQIVLIPFDAYINHNAKITYSTQLTDAAKATNESITANNLINKVKMIWHTLSYGPGPGTPLEWKIDISKDVTNTYNYVQKSATAFDGASHTQGWHFKINQYQQAITNLVITEEGSTATTALAGQWTYTQYTGGAAVKTAVIPEYKTGMGTTPYPYYKVETDALGHSVVNFYFGNLTANDYYEVNIKTDVTDQLATGTGADAADKTTLKNTAKVTTGPADNRTITESPAEIQVENVLINKTTTSSYNAQDHTIGWSVAINSQKLDLTDAVLTDILPEGNVFKTLDKVVRTYKDRDGTEKTQNGTITGDTITFDGTSIKVTQNQIKATNGTTGTSTDTVKWTFTQETNDESTYTFSFTTQMGTTDADKAYLDKLIDHNTTESVINNAQLSGKIGKNTINDKDNHGYVADSAPASVANKALSKSGHYNETAVKEGGQIIHEAGTVTWSVILNQGQVDMTGKKVVEDFTDNPILQLVIPQTGNAVKVESADMNGSDIGTKTDVTATVASAFTNTTAMGFTFTVPESVHNKVLIFTFDTYITDDVDLSQVKNTVKLMPATGSTPDETVTGGNNGSGEFWVDDGASGKINPYLKVNKVSSNANVDGLNLLKLAGATYKISAYDWNETANAYVKTTRSLTVTTQDTGRATFMNLHRDTLYRLEETAAPAGYALDITPSYLIFRNDASSGHETPSTITLKEKAEDTGVNVTTSTEIVAASKKTLSLTKSDIPTTSFTFTKVGTDTTTPLKDITFTLMRTTDNKVAPKTATSDANGVVTFEKLDPGDYILTETSASKEYDTQGGDTITVTADGRVTHTKKDAAYTLSGAGTEGAPYKVTNHYVKGRIKITKYDSEILKNNTANVLPVGGAIYGLYTKNVDNTYTAVPDVSNVQTQYNPKGEATFVNVPYSTESYYIHEVTAETGYTLNSEYREVTAEEMKNGMTGAENKAFSISKDLTDTRVRGNITLTKTHKKDNVDTTPLAGREFEITYTDKDGYTAWQTSIQANETALTVKGGKYYATTNENGAIALTNVPYGNYKLTEVFPENDKYQGPKTIAITREDVITGKSSIVLKSLTNELRKASFSIVKTDTFGDTLPNIEFTLEGVDADGNTFNQQTKTTGNTPVTKGVATFDNIPIGNYTLTETPPAGFETLAITTYYIKVESEGNGTKVSYSTTKGGAYTVLRDKSKLKIENTPITGSLSFIKKDTDGRTLAGITFKLQRVLHQLQSDGSYKDSVEDVKNNNQVVQKTTGTDGKVSFDYLPYGNYQLVEINQAGIRAATPTKFYRVGENNGVNELIVEKNNVSFTTNSDTQVTNTLKKATINLTKVDENNTPLSGITFTVQRQGTAEENDPNSFVLRGWTESGDEYHDYQIPSTTEASGWAALKGITGIDGKLSLGGLVEGNYRLVETLPVNTTSGQTTIPVTFIVSDGKITNLKVNGKDVSTTGDTTTANITVANQIKYGYVNLKKVSDGTTGVALPGSTFTIYTKDAQDKYYEFVTDIAVDKTGNLISNSDGSYGSGTNKKWLVYGTYYMKETAPIKGFTANANYHPFTIGDDTTGHQGTAWISADAGETGTVTYKKATAGITTPQIDTTTFINTAIRGSISLTKVDAGDTTKAVSGAVFTVYDGTTAVATLTESTTTPGTYDVVTSLDKDKNMGTSTTAINIPYIQEGKFLAGTYTIKETTTPGNYQKVDANTILKTVVIAAGGTAAYYNGDQTQTSGNSQVTNTLLTGSLTIKKYNGLTDILEYEVYKEKMAGVIFTLTGNDLNGNPIGTDGKGITVKTDANGEATLAGIPLGDNYTLSETPVPGYVTMTPKTVKLTAENYTAKVEMEGKLPENGVFKITNTPITGTLSFTKNAGSNRTLQGVEFELIGVYDGRTVFTKTVKSDENGKVTFENIPYVNYRLEEKTKDIVNGMSEESISTSDLTISEDNTTFTGTVTYGTKGTGIVDNTLNTNGVLKFTKVDQNGKAIKIAGISFEVYRKGSSGENNKFNLYPGSDEAYQPYYVAVQTDSEATGEYKKCIVTTNKDGYIAQGFPIGEYKLVEVVDATNPIHQALTGTQPLEATFKVELDRYKDLVIVNAEGLKPSGYKYTFTNNITYGTLQIQKVFGEQDSNTAGQTLPTATFDIFRRIGDTQPGAEDKPVTTLTTNDKGQFDASVNTLMGGDYWLKEVSITEDTYAVDSTYYPFTIKDQEETVISTRTAEDEHQVFNNAAKRGTLTVTKLDEKYALDADGNLVAKTGEDGQKLGGADFILVAGDKLITHLQDNKDGTYTLPDTAKAAEAVAVDGITYTPVLTNALGTAYIHGGKALMGAYGIIEVKAPAGYTEKTTPVEVTIQGDMALPAATAKITNALIEQPFKITKSVEVLDKDAAINHDGKAETNTEAANGFTFTIERTNATDPVFDYTKTVTTQKVGEENGIADFGQVPFGTYSVTETASDSTGKYLLPETALGTLTVDAQGATYAPSSGAASSVENAAITNTLKRGSIKGRKVDKTTLTGISTPVAGATMGLYSQDGKTLLLETQTDNQGDYHFDNVPYGQYTIKEVKAPAGYCLNETQTLSVKVETHGQTIALEDIIDVPVTQAVKLHKIDGDTKAVMAGISFTLEGKNFLGNTVKMTKTTDSNGDLTFEKILQGNYTITETKPDAYKTPDTHTLAVTNVEKDKSNVSEVKLINNTTQNELAVDPTNQAYTIVNTEIKQTLTFTKYGTNDEIDLTASAPVAGAVFGLYSDAATTAKVAEATSNQNGRVTFTDLTMGTWYLKEIQAPANYTADSAIYYTVVNKDDTITELKKVDGDGQMEMTAITNEAIRGSMTVVKVDETNPEKRLPGSTYGLYKKMAVLGTLGTGGETTQVNEGEAVPSGYKKLGEGITDAQGKVVFGNLLIGNEYMVKELKAPAGYQVSEHPITLTFKLNASNLAKPDIISTGGGTITVDENGEVTWFEPPTRVSLEKVDEQGKAVMGAVLQLTDARGKVVDQWTTTQAHHLMRGVLVVGEAYTLTELQAPAGYTLAAPITFVVDAKNVGYNALYTQHVKMVDKAVVPKPGGTENGGNTAVTTIVTSIRTNLETGIAGGNNLAMAGIILGVAALVVIVLVVYRRKH